METEKSANKPVQLNLNSRFYDIGAIEEAIKDFRQLCDCKVSRSQGRLFITLNPTKDCQNLDREFCNYALGLMKNRASV